MLKRPHQALTAIGLAVGLLAVTATYAQSKPSSGREAFYRCKDKSGQTHYGDSLPAACSGYDTEVLNDRGTLVRLIEGDRKSTRLNSSHLVISYAVFCLKKTTNARDNIT